MGLRDMLKKKDRLDEGYNADADTVNKLQVAPEFTFIRSDTHTQEVIYPPQGPAPQHDAYLTAKDSDSKPRRSLDVFKSRSRGNSVSSVQSDTSKKDKESGPRRLSQRLHLSREPASSDYVPDNLPQINIPGDGSADKDVAEREWENRATILAAQNENARSRSATPLPSPAAELAELNLNNRRPVSPARQKSDGTVSTQKIDADIQEAIRLHEEGDLERSTQLFGHLADPQGANNPLSQVLYGLALRLVYLPVSRGVSGSVMHFSSHI